MARHFNTAGPNRPEKHDTLPALDRHPDRSGGHAPPALTGEEALPPAQRAAFPT